MATEVYFNSAKSYQSKAFLTPAEARKIQDLLKSLRQSVEEGYAPCTPRSRLLSRLSGLDLAVGRCLERTRHHWQKPNLKVVMDSIGLVAVDPKQEVHIEEEVNWKRAEPMGTSWEESLVASVRPHLFKYWREEDESEGYSFDDSSDDCEASLMEHLHSLAFYRYVGKAKTPDAFTREARKAFYFGVEHAWFKQKLLQS